MKRQNKRCFRKNSVTAWNLVGSNQVKAASYCLLFTAICLLLLVGCGDSAESTPIVSLETPITLPTRTVEVVVSAEPTATPEPEPKIEATTKVVRVTATPFVLENPSAPCGVQLPLTLDAQPATTSISTTLPTTATIPIAALPAVEHLWQNPQSVGLAAYRVGDEANGVYINADTPMALASVSKLVHLVAYAEAVEAGTLIPLDAVPIDELERYYLAGSDLRSHTKSINELRGDDKLAAEDAVYLHQLPWMMIRHSSNAATDYLHRALGQETIEQTVSDLGLTQHTAPCPFVGQFLTMHNNTRRERDAQALQLYLEDEATYGRDAAYLTDLFAQSETFNSAENRNWGRPDPSVRLQSNFVSEFGTKGTARDYANLLARIVSGNLGSPRVNSTIRNQLEWPLDEFESNRELFTTIGYKGGTLPGVITTVYYAWPWGSQTPIVVVLFYEDLEIRTYQSWRRSLTHDEFARWLLYDPTAIDSLRTSLGLNVESD